MMHEIVVHVVQWLFISFYDYDCHVNFIIFVHLFDTLELKCHYFINELVTNVEIILLILMDVCVFSLSFKSVKTSCFTHTNEIDYKCPTNVI